MNEPPRFKVIPEEAELHTIERDLRFGPADPEAARTFSRDEVERFNREGYLKGIRIFDEAEALANRRYFDALLARVLAAGGTSYSISTAHLRHGKVYDLLTDPRLVRCVRDLLGEDVVGWGSHYFCKLPHDGKTAPWHQDASYWPLSSSRTVTVWLAIDDADRDNACMQFIPGSHLLGHLPYRKLEGEAEAVLDQEVVDVGRFGAPVDVELRSGEVSIHSDLLLHGSAANGSDRRRAGLTLRYSAAEVRAGLGWNAKGVVVSGRDRDGHWANPPRPADD